MKGTEIAERGKQQLAELTGLAPGTVSAMSHDEEGWHVAVDMIELRKVPDSTDVLAVYEALLNDQGELLTYKRMRRYRRDQITEEAG
jgi:hypothetical protein